MTFVEMGRRGGESRRDRLSPARRSEIARMGGLKRQDKGPPVHEVVKRMMLQIRDTARPHVLFLDDGRAFFCESGSAEALAITARLGNAGTVGTYCTGATFSDVMNDVLAL